MGSKILHMDISLSLLFAFSVSYATGSHACSESLETKGSYYVPKRKTYGVNDKIHYTCYSRAAYYIGSRTRTCLHNGIWSGSLLYCGCLQPAFPAGDGTFTPSRAFYRVEEIVRYECYSKQQQSYIFGNSTRTCLENGTWSGPLPYCVSESRLQLHYNKEGQKLLIDGKTDTCLYNNENIDNGQVFINHTGKFKTIIVQIISNQYEEKTEVYHTAHHGSHHSFRHTSFKSIDGSLYCHSYIYNSPKELTDSVIGIGINSCAKENYCRTCEVIVFTDKIASCPWLVPPNNGTFITFDKQPSNNHSFFEYGSAAVYTCSEGFRLKGNQIRRCDVNSKWTGGNTSCIATRCSQEPPALKNGIWSKWKSGMLYTINSTLEAVCECGYINYGHPIMVTCSSEETWSPKFIEAQCQPIQCSQELPSLKNAIWSEWENGTTYSVNYTLVAICKAGFINFGQLLMITCSCEGLWLPYFPEDRCQEIKCAIPTQAIHNSYWSMKSSMKSFPLGSKLEIICEHGYERTGVSVNITCVSMGNWTLSDVVCTAIEEPITSSRKIVIISIAVVGLFLVCLCLGFCIFWTRRSIAKRSQNKIHQTEVLLENPVYNSASSDLQNEEYTTSIYFQSQSDPKKSKNKSVLLINQETENTEMVINDLYLTECPIAKPLYAHNSAIYEEIDNDEQNESHVQFQPASEKGMQETMVENEIYSIE